MKIHEGISKSYIETIAKQIIGGAIYVHRHLGPGLLESVYEAAMKEELRHRGLKFEVQRKISITFRETKLSTELRCDLVVEDLIICELKSVEEIAPVHQAQLLSYMRLAQLPKGLLLNFNTPIMREGIRSMVNDLYKNLPE